MALMAVMGLLEVPQKISGDPRRLCGSHLVRGQGRTSTGCRPLTPTLAFFLYLVRPTDMIRKVKRQAPRERVVCDKDRVLGFWPAGRTNLVCDPLTVGFRPVGRASPSPTLFRRKHAFSVGSGGRGAAHRRKEGTKPPRLTS